MNYVILNGVKSTTIRGLLIQELPPIVKPMIRRNIEEIDGVDGDIVTELGYSAYDRQMNIGLYGKFDIDEVMGYFNSQGNAIFSNEPDKVYKYKILEQIDFERLFRYKTAIVTFHVQPFKYPINERAIQQQLELFKFVDGSMADDNIKYSGNTLEFTLQNMFGTSLPIEQINYKAGKTYKLVTDLTGTQDGGVQIDISGEDYIYYNANETGQKEIEFSFREDTPAQEIYIFPNGTNNDFKVEFSIKAVDDESLVVINKGNYKSTPLLKLTGKGTVGLNLNGLQILNIDFGDESQKINIDIEKSNAFNDSGDYKNRLVIGNYNKLKLNVGKNVISWSGNLQRVEIENYSRFI